MTNYPQWLNEKIERTPIKNGWYRFFCYLTFRKMLRYKDLYLILTHLNSKFGEEKAKENALKQIIEIYKFNYNKEPII